MEKGPLPHFFFGSLLTSLQHVEAPVAQTQISHSRLNETQMCNVPAHWLPVNFISGDFSSQKAVIFRTMRQHHLQHIDPIHPGTRGSFGTKHLYSRSFSNHMLLVIISSGVVRNSRKIMVPKLKS